MSVAVDRACGRPGGQPAARFKDLCLDAVDPHVLGAFWARALGGDLVDLGDGDTRVDGRTGVPGPESIWVNRVPEPRSRPTRVRLDLRLDRPDPAGLLAAGARLVRAADDGAGWWGLADPEGNEFRAFAPRPELAGGPCGLVVDARDPAAQAAWWAGVVGGRTEPDGDGGVSVVTAAGFPWRSWSFAPAAGPRTVKNRMHWDVDLTDDGCGALLDAGATLLREPDADIGWWGLADPEGNEFCAFRP